MKKAILLTLEELRRNEKTRAYANTLYVNSIMSSWFFSLPSNFHPTDEMVWRSNRISITMSLKNSIFVKRTEGEAQIFHYRLEVTNLSPLKFIRFIRNGWRPYAEEELKKWLLE